MIGGISNSNAYFQNYALNYSTNRMPSGQDQGNNERVSAHGDRVVKKGYKSSPADCQTCRERKYQDGSNETDVSFKSPGHISPEASASTVMAHEKQHVANAYQKASEKDGRVAACSVSLQTAVCPECGTVYVSGGTTRTAVTYSDESNPYQKNKKAQDAIRLVGANIDYAA